MTTDRHHWVAIENDLPDHPKIAEVGPIAAWLYVSSICYADRFKTDGWIPGRMLTRLGGVDYSCNVSEEAERLVEAGLWEANGAGWMIHDYTKHQQTKQELRDKKEALSRIRAEVGRKGGLASGEARRKQNEALDTDKDIYNPPTPLEPKRPNPQGRPDPKGTNLTGSGKVDAAAAINKCGCTHNQCRDLEECYYQ